MTARISSWVAWVSLSVLAASSLQAVDFEKEIHPILKERCFECHGPDKSESGLRLDRRVGLLKGGDSGMPAVVPGKAEKSLLLEAVKGTDPKLVMPKEGKRLSETQIQLFEKWINEGAEWPGQMDEVVEVKTDHWSYQPIVRHEVPAGAKHPVDAFLLKGLKDAGVKANSSADARTLIRRVSVILTGLPPTSERVAKFATDYASNADVAYEKLVDELLASDHFGERWAQHWLDVIRWAETNGSEANLYRRNSWVYRDYVIRAFNEDLPYDQFVQDQIAGDTRGAGDATGFLVAGPHVPAATVGQEPTAIRQARADRMDEVIQTVGASMMGVTMGCARCHNHKFDPVSIKDYYSMVGVFQDVEFGARFPEFAPEHPRKLRAGELWKELAKQRKQLSSGGAWEEDWSGYSEFHFPQVVTDALRITFKKRSVTVDELEVFGAPGKRTNLARPQLGTKVKGPEDMLKIPAHINRLTDGKFGRDSWRAKVNKKSKTAKTDTPWIELTFSAPQEIARIRMSADREYFFESDYLNTDSVRPYTEYTLEVRDAQGKWVKVYSTDDIQKKQKADPARAKFVNSANHLVQQLVEEGPRMSFIGRLIEPVTTRVFHRGSPENPRDEVAPAAPLILHGELGLNSASAGSDRRQKFASWLIEPSNPLTARVMANRIWHHTFGAGIVPTTSDFGIAGAKPKHPEMLDWLALELMESSSNKKTWSVKSMIRLLVTSEAFRRSSQPNETAMRADADSALLWRYPPRRVEAEVIRDSVLLASGKLDRTIGGRGYRIHNEKEKYAQWEVVDNHGPATWRRMIYQERMRRVDDLMFTAFDFPDCGQIREKRPVSTTPLQALNLMNSPFIVEQSKMIAERASREAKGGDTAAAVVRAFELLLARQPDPEELSACIQVADEAGLHIVCRSLINSNEFAFLP